MNKQQAQEIIKNTFENPFDKVRFTTFIKNFLNRIDDAPFTYQGNYIPDAYKPYIKTLERIGKFSDGENSIDVLIITLLKETSLERARTMQRNFIAWYLNGSRGGEMKDAALVAYVSPDKEDWRFSLIKMDYRFDEKGKVKEEFTPARRWSFLVGANEKSHTAQSRLVKILADDECPPTMQEIEKAFDIEIVTKEFFLKYRELFLRTREALDQVVENNVKVRDNFEAKGVDTVNFAKKLLGQIIFLYFLQKKGWFGVGRDDNWGTGSKKFLRELYEKKHSDYNNFFNDILEPLFYEALRTGEDRKHEDYYYSRFDCKIPFLNGGLFDPIGNYDWVHTDIILPDSLFSNENRTKEGDNGDGILDIFDRYNFTVKEDEPLEKEVAIDPELLGKSYEKFNAIRPDNYDEFKKALKSGKTGEENKFNKKFGVYYTPREIVHYMCQQSLINYLTTELEGKAKKEAIEFFILEGEKHIEHLKTAKEKNEKNANYQGDYKEKKHFIELKKYANQIDTSLSKIKVCDPAVGSGAFPVGMMAEIVKARMFFVETGCLEKSYINSHKKKVKRTPYNFKRDCIENSLYGVDIDPGAVEIAKLRLWLSLVVDEENIKNIKPLPNLDYKIVCGNSLLGVEKNLFNFKLFNELERLKPLFFNETNPTKKQEYKKQIDKLISEITNGHTEFDFEVYFSEVFHQKGGFDVVIANPPYVGEKGHKEIFRPIADSEFGRKYYNAKMDIFYFFFHKGIDIGKLSSSISFITTNYYVTATGAKKLRFDFKNRTTIKKLINFNELNIFDSAKGQHNIITILEKRISDDVAKTCITKRIGVATFNILNEILTWQDVESNYYNIKHKNLFEGSSNYIRINGVETDSSNPINVVLNKLKDSPKKLLEVSNINSGCDITISRITKKHLEAFDGNFEYGDGVFVINDDELKSIGLNNNEKLFLKDFIKNSDIYPYRITLSKDKLIYIRWEDDVRDCPSLKKHLERFKKILVDQAQRYEEDYPWYALHRPRDQAIFESNEKILVPYRNKRNIFGYSTKSVYSSRDVFFITKMDNQYDLKFLVGLLNSKLLYLWLYNKGKRKGEILELYHKPLSEIPIKEISSEQQKPFIHLIDQILAITKDDDYLQNPQKQAKVKAIEREIDQLVYKLYGLTPEEIKIVESS